MYVNQGEKLRSYGKFKTEIKFESCFDIKTDFKIRRQLIQFHLGVHDLEIERGRYGRKPLPIERRSCKLCLGMIQAVEDEKTLLTSLSILCKTKGSAFKT